MKKLKAIFLFIFIPSAFNSMAVKHHQQFIDEANKNRGWSPNKANSEELSSGNLKQSSKLRASFFESIFIVLVTFFISFSFSYIFVKFNYFSSNAHVMAYLFTGAFIILAVTLWQIGNAASASGELLHEKVHNWLFKITYTIGTFFLGLGGGVDGFQSILLP